MPLNCVPISAKDGKMASFNMTHARIKNLSLQCAITRTDLIVKKKTLWVFTSHWCLKLCCKRNTVVLFNFLSQWLLTWYVDGTALSYNIITTQHLILRSESVCGCGDTVPLCICVLQTSIICIPWCCVCVMRPFPVTSASVKVKTGSQVYLWGE